MVQNLDNMKEEKFTLESLIGGWYIDPKICDRLVKYFEKNKKRHMEGKIGGGRLDQTIKSSTDVPLHGTDTLLDDYNVALQNCLELYLKRYPEVNAHDRFSSSVEPYNIQKYKPGQGFYNWHCENMGTVSKNRVLVFMTYLNDVKDGGTYFKYQNLLTKAKKGLTLIWPASFSHMHKGQVAQETKYIITGWYNFY